MDEDGLYLKHEIREWMKYREEKEIAKVLEDIIRNTKKNDGERKECQEEVDSAETDVKKEQDEEVNQETKEETNKKDTESDLKGDVDKNTALANQYKAKLLSQYPQSEEAKFIQKK